MTEHKAQQALKDHRVILEPRVIRVHKALMALKAYKVLMEHKALKV